MLELLSTAAPILPELYRDTRIFRVSRMALCLSMLKRGCARLFVPSYALIVPSIKPLTAALL